MYIYINIYVYQNIHIYDMTPSYIYAPHLFVNLLARRVLLALQLVVALLSLSNILEKSGPKSFHK